LRTASANAGSGVRCGHRVLELEVLQCLFFGELEGIWDGYFFANLTEMRSNNRRCPLCANVGLYWILHFVNI
jgi:hypothetical protein